jgi:hypothetical protein
LLAVIRRTALVVGALVVALGLSSCSTLSTNHDVASVGDHTLSRDDFQTIAESDLSSEVLQSQVVTDGTADGNAARSLISVWVLLNAIQDAKVIGPQDTAAIETTLKSRYATWDSAPQAMKDLLIADQVVGTSVSQGEIDQAEIGEIIADADIAVDARYGYWEPDAGNFGAVVAFG